MNRLNLSFAATAWGRIVPGMRQLGVIMLISATIMSFGVARVFADTNAHSRAIIGPMKTSIYVGSVSLTTSEFERNDSHWSATYQAKVFPWFFWGEMGRISILISAVEL